MTTDQTPTLLSLPTEINEEILVYCALYGSYPSISAVSQTCRSFRDIFYNTTDTAIWREIFLVVFDDPRIIRKIRLAPVGGTWDGCWSWREAYQKRVEMKVQLKNLYLYRNHHYLEPEILTRHMKTLSSLVQTSLPYSSDVGIQRNQSSNLQWLNDLLSSGFPKVLTQRLISMSPSTSEESTGPEYLQYKADLMHPDWELSEAGQRFYQVLLWTGFLPYVHPPSSSSTPEDSGSEEESPVEFTTYDSLGNTVERDHTRSGSHQYELRSVVKRLEREAATRLEAVTQRRLACIVAQHRVYNMRYLSKDRCWGPFLSQRKEKGKNKAPPVEPEPEDKTNEQGTSGSSNERNGSNSSERTALRIFREILDFGAPIDESEDMHDEDADEDYVPPSQDNDMDDDSSSSSEFDIRTILHPHILGDDNFAVPSSPGPIYPTQPHLLFPDYVFLSAARIVVETDLRDILNKEYSSNSTLFRPHFTHLSARKSTEELFRRIDSSSSDSQRDGLNMLRMGTAPGFWDGKGTKEGWLNLSSKEEHIEGSESGITDGWDWAGVEGRWTRAVTWMDYRDLLEHSLRAISPLAPHSQLNHHIDGTRRAFNMNLRIKGYSRVEPPPATSSSVDPLDNLSPSDRLVYTLPIIHLDGDFRSADASTPSFGYSDMDTRRVTGTVRMIGGGAVRWTLGTVLQSGDQEWVMEGIQIGEIGSGLGVVGLWTGADHERGDPIGATWAWKSE